MYKDLTQYITQRLVAVGENASSMAERLGWSATYLHNIINGQFRPSRKRCVLLAKAFDDDPNIILALAGFYVPGDTEHEEYTQMLNSLDDNHKKMALEYLYFLKWRQDSL